MLTGSRRRSAGSAGTSRPQQRTTFSLALDLRLAHGFRRDVLTHLQATTYGTTLSYSALAAAAGRPRAFRSAGSACATNPLPIVVPCHRAVLANGGRGRYVGGTAAKDTLLEMEAEPHPDRNGRKPRALHSCAHSTTRVPSS